MRENMYRGIPKDNFDGYAFANIWKDNCEGNFVYGSLVVSNDRYYICVSALCKINCCINNGMTSMIEVIPETIGQYTGLTDKNGKKIFEGDIVKHYNNSDDGFDIGVLYWDEAFLQFKRTSIGNFHDSSFTYSMSRSCEYEVIGNIHDNPELLKGAENNG